MHYHERLLVIIIIVINVVMSYVWLQAFKMCCMVYW